MGREEGICDGLALKQAAGIRCSLDSTDQWVLSTGPLRQCLLALATLAAAVSLTVTEPCRVVHSTQDSGACWNP